MSDLMLHGVLNMPLPDDPTECDLMTWVQFKDRARQASDRIEELEAKLAKAVERLDKLIYWLDIDQELWDALTVMEKSDHRHMQSEVQAVKDILTGGKP